MADPDVAGGPGFAGYTTDVGDSALHRIAAELVDSLTRQGAPGDEVVLQLAMLLERASHRSQGDEFYRTILTDDALEVTLSEVDVGEIVDKLGRLILSERMTSSMLWAVGVSYSPSGLFHLIDLFENRGHLLSEEETFQGLIALRNLLVEVGALDENEDRAILDRIHSASLEKNLVNLTRTGNQRNIEEAEGVLELLRSLKRV